jgi:hypothetical protein
MEESKPQLSRRDALKALVAAGGALTAAAFLPGKWAKPLVEAGVLPAHAQSSCPTVTTDYNYGFCDNNHPCTSGGLAWITLTWSPAATPTGFSVTFGGLPVVPTYQHLTTTGGEINFNLAQGFQGYITVITVQWGNCPPSVIQFEWPN